MVAVAVAAGILVWARKERGLSLEVASERLRMAATELAEIEGTREVSLSLLEHIATHYRLPLVSLLLPEAPTIFGRPLHDFRAFEGTPAAALSPETLLAIDQAWELLELLADLKYSDPIRVPKCSIPPTTLSDNPIEIAKRERERLNVIVGEQIVWGGDREAFLRWRETVESQGMFTYQMKFGEDDVRGLSLWDDKGIPIAVIDSAEGSYQAKIFTLWHEYAHIMLRMGGISNQNRKNNIERFCNAFAAHFLMPMDRFIFEARRVVPRNGEIADRQVTRLANLFKVSKSAVALHLEEANLVPSGFYAKMKKLWVSNVTNTNRGRAEHQEKIANRLGGRHILTVLSAYRDGVLNKIDAEEYLANTRPIYFDAVEQVALSRRVAYGRTG